MIDRLPGDSKESVRRFQIAIESHLTAQSKHCYPGTFSDWYYTILNVFAVRQKR